MQYLMKLKEKLQNALKTPISVIKRPFIKPTHGFYTPVLMRDLTKINFKSKMIRDVEDDGSITIDSACVTMLMGVELRLAYLEADEMDLEGLYPIGIDNVKVSDAWMSLAEELSDQFDEIIQWIGYSADDQSSTLIIGVMKDSNLAIAIANMK